MMFRTFIRGTTWRAPVASADETASVAESAVGDPEKDAARPMLRETLKGALRAKRPAGRNPLTPR